MSALQRWCTENFLDLHPERCKILSFFHCSTTTLYIGNTLLDSIQSFKDLGVIFTSNLSWSLHVADKISKCYKVFFMLKRNVPMSASRSLKINLYKTCILSILSYASPVWSSTKTDLQKLESLNKRCIQCTGMTGDYNSTLLNLNIYPISYKLEISDLLLFHRLFHGKYDLNIFDYVTLSESRLSLRSSNYCMFVLKNLRYLQTRNFYFDRVVRLVNHLKIDARDSFCEWKRKIHLFYKSKLQTYNEKVSCTWSAKCICLYCHS